MLMQGLAGSSTRITIYVTVRYDLHPLHVGCAYEARDLRRSSLVSKLVSIHYNVWTQSLISTFLVTTRLYLRKPDGKSHHMKTPIHA